MNRDGDGRKMSARALERNTAPSSMWVLFYPALPQLPLKMAELSNCARENYSTFLGSHMIAGSSGMNLTCRCTFWARITTRSKLRGAQHNQRPVTPCVYGPLLKS